MKTPNMRLAHLLMVGAGIAIVCAPTMLLAQAKKPNPASKIYISDVAGEAEIDIGDFVEDLNRRSVYPAQGAVIETKKPADGSNRTKSYSTMVYSNGTGAFFDADTHVEIRRFVQEPFLPNRADMEVEPSLSETHAFVSRGTVGLCTSKLVAGSTMSYATPLGSVNIRGRKIVIQTESGVTKISMLEGESTVRAGSMDMGGQTVHNGEQAIIRPGEPGQPNRIEVVKIPPAELSQLDEKVTMACMAKRTVYFDTRTRQQNNNDSGTGGVDMFDTLDQSRRVAGDPFTNADGEIVAIPVVPGRPPVQFTISPATLTTPGQVVTPGQGTPTPGQGGQPTP